MSLTKTTKVKRASADQAAVVRLYVLDASAGRIFTANADGSDLKTIVTGCRVPDGIVVDIEAGHIYWTNMGNPKKNDGSIERVDLDGRNRKAIVPEGGTFTPKQLHLEKASGKLYWCDREGMRVMRCNLDGSKVETLVDTSGGDPRPGPDETKQCVGITVDPERGKLYWTQKGAANAGRGRIFRANLELPQGQTPANRGDIELLFDHLPEPIDLELDLQNRVLYWTDRGDPPRGNTVNRARLDPATGKPTAPEIVVTHLEEGIGIALDVAGDRMFVTDLAGSVHTARLDGSENRTLLAACGNLTGITLAKTPNKEN
jgi:DNA-binding beta-propeller fold protein YncE